MLLSLSQFRFSLKSLLVAIGLLCVALVLWQLAPRVMEHLFPPTHAFEFSDRAARSAARGDYISAIEDYDEAIRIDPRYSYAYRDRGKMYLLLDQPEQAIVDLEHSLRLLPDDSDALIVCGIIYARLGRTQDALDRFSDCIQICPSSHPDMALALENRGRMHCRLGQHEAAIHDFNEVLKREPNSATAYYMRGFAYYEMGDKAKAEANFKRATQLDPALRKEPYGSG